MRYLIATAISNGFAICLAISGPAQAGSFCADLDAMMTAAQTGLTPATDLQITLPGDRSARATCGFSLDISGQRSANCSWAYPYRSSKATEAFGAIQSAISTCAEGTQDTQTQKPVNHPDTYDLRLFEYAGGEVGLSLKDKAALQETYIFLRSTPPE